MKTTPRMILATGATLAALAMSMGTANARSEPEYLQREACEAMDSGYSFTCTTKLLMMAHSGLEIGDAGWAALHGIANYCSWHEKDVPENLQKYVIP